MINYATWCKMKTLYEKEHLKPSQIARMLNLAPRTVRKWVKEPTFKPRKTYNRSSILDPFKGQIMGLLQSHDYSAVQMLNILREQNYKGGYTIVKDYIQEIRPRYSQAYLTLSFAPGECAQVDWGCWGSVPVGSTRRRLSFFVMVLCYSRMMYLEFTLGQTQEHFLTCHRHAFEFFQAVTERVMVDNCKTAVLSHPAGLEPAINPRYADFASHYGFTVKACGVGKGNEKGIVENAVGYIKKNFLRGRQINEFDSLNPAARLWLDTTANVRIHGRTKKRPVDLFKTEHPLLTPLPAHPYDCAELRAVHANTQFRVVLESNRYSVPAEYAGSKLLLKLYPDQLCLYARDKLIAEHLRSYDRGRDFENPDHVRELLKQKRNARDQHILKRFLALSSHAEQYYRQLTERRLNSRLHLRKIVALCDIYGDEKVARALQDALYYRAFSSEYIANILEQRSRTMPEPGPLHLIRKQDMLELDLPAPDLSVYESQKGE